MKNEILNIKVTKEELLTIKAALLEKAYRYKELKSNCTNDDQISQYAEIISDVELAFQTIRVSERFNEVKDENWNLFRQWMEE